MPSFIPARESELVTFSVNFDAKITADPTAYGLDIAQAAAYNVLHVAFATSYQTANNPDTRSPSNITAKDSARDALVDGPGGIRELARIVQATPGISDQRIRELGLTVRDTEPTPVPPPAVAPNLSIASIAARTVSVRLQDQENPSRRSRPDGVQAATILYHVGDEAPDDPSTWIFGRIASKTSFNYEVPVNVAAGSKVWLTAFWFNARGESSPAATPESVRVSDGLAAAA